MRSTPTFPEIPNFPSIQSDKFPGLGISRLIRAKDKLELCQLSEGKEALSLLLEHGVTITEQVAEGRGQQRKTMEEEYMCVKKGGGGGEGEGGGEEGCGHTYPHFLMLAGCSRKVLTLSLATNGPSPAPPLVKSNCSDFSETEGVIVCTICRRLRRRRTLHTYE